MFKKIVVITSVILLIILGMMYKEQLVFMVNEGGVFAVFVAMLLVSIVVFFPIIPFPVLGAIIGGVFGIWIGSLITLIGAMIGTMLMFFLTRYGFKDSAQEKVKHYPKIKEYEEKFEKNPFLTILFVRLIPIVPSPVVNVLTALSRVKWWVFFVATFIGKIPNNLLVNFVGSAMEENKIFAVGVYVSYLVILMILVYIFNKKSEKVKK